MERLSSISQLFLSCSNRNTELALFNPHCPDWIEVKIAYAALYSMKCPSPCNTYPTYETLSTFHFYIIIIMADVRKSYLPEFHKFRSSQPQPPQPMVANNLCCFTSSFHKRKVPFRLFHLLNCYFLEHTAERIFPRPLESWSL